MKQSQMPGLLQEAGCATCDPSRRTAIRKMFVDAAFDQTSKAIVGHLITQVLDTHPERLMEQFGALAVICGDRVPHTTRVCADLIEWHHMPAYMQTSL